MNGPQLAAQALALVEASRKPTPGRDSGAAERNIARAQVFATLALAAATIDAATTLHGPQESWGGTSTTVDNAEVWRRVFAPDPEEGTDG